MEKECSRCHRQFQPSQAGVEVCPDCLRSEFAAARPLNAAEHEELLEHYRVSERRQTARARQMQLSYLSGSIFSMVGKLQFLLGCIMFLVSAFLFVMLSSEGENPIFNGLDMVGKRIISMLLCSAGAGLVFFSTRNRPWLTYPMPLIFLVCGWFMPEAATPAEKSDADKAAVAQAETEEAQNESDADGRALNAADLDVFVQQKKSAPQAAHYAVYMSNQDARTRSVVRDALTRLLGAEYTRAYTRNEGALYVISNIPGKTKNISHTLNRFGRITYSAPAEGVYELRFDAEKTHMVSRYPVEVLASPGNGSYVPANIEELTSMEAMRIRSAATNLHNSNVQMLRHEIHDALVQVMQDPWGSDFDTYSALAEAMATYAYPNKDKQAIELCRRFFRTGLEQKRVIPESVTAYLVKEVPDEMVEPVVDFWCENPIVWNETMVQLGNRVQKPLTEKLSKADNLRLIGSAIRFLKDHGDSEAAAAIQPFTNHTDSLIRHAAQEAINTLQNKR